MSSCPKCKQTVDALSLTCPNCGNDLKAFGHPGIPLYQSEDNEYLCDRCIYDKDDTCNYPQRPQAKSCTLFHDFSVPLISETVVPRSQEGWRGVKNRLYRNRGAIAIAFLVIISVLVALKSS